MRILWGSCTCKEEKEERTERKEREERREGREEINERRKDIKGGGGRKEKENDRTSSS